LVIEVAAQRVDSDAEVILRSLREPNAFFDLFDRHYRPLYRFLVARGSLDIAEDVSAETFVVAFRRRADYDLRRADARSWLFGIAVNLARNHRRAEGRRARVLRRLTVRPDEPYAAVLARLDAQRLPLREALASLSPQERDLLILHACLDLTYDELAETFALPLGTVRSRLHRARAKVRRLLEGGLDAGR
jgi:RNA polymerase sigma-70 factor (ECF subfamily)